MLQQNANVTSNCHIHAHNPMHARCCSVQASSAMTPETFAAMSPLGRTPPNAHRENLSNHHQHQHYHDLRPKRDFQFRVIQVRQGPKWFILPSLHKSHNNSKNINLKNVEKPAVDSVANPKPTKPLYLKLNTQENASDQENNCLGMLSPITPETPARFFPLNYENVENIMANAPRIPSPASDDDSTMNGERDGMAKVTATNQLAYYPVPFSEPTSRRLPSFQMPILDSKTPLPPSPLTNSPPQQPNFCVGNRGVWLDEKEVADLYASYAESQEKYQEKLENIAHRLQQNQQHPSQIQRTKSVVNAPTQIADSYAVDVGYILGDAILSHKPVTHATDTPETNQNANATSGETSGYASTASTTAAASANNSGAFEILAVSKKEENEDTDFELEANTDKHHFADSGYSASAPDTRNCSRSGSVVEYYSSSGCYTCIQGEFLNANQQKTEEDLTKRYSLCMAAFQMNNNNNNINNDEDRTNNNLIENNNNEYICDNCKNEYNNDCRTPSNYST